MRRLILLSALVLLIAPSQHGQAIQKQPSNTDEANLKKLGLFYDLQALDAESKKLNTPLSRALAKAEIADAAWWLDQEWARKLLRESYELTLPEEETRIRLRNKPAGAAPTIPTGDDVARNNIRNRVLRIASRDKNFLDELAQLGAEQLGKQEEHYRYASLAESFVAAGEMEAASNYILKAIEVDPTILNAGIVIFDIAARDRKAADKLILQYIERLRAFPLSQINNSAWRTYLFLRDLVFTKNTSYSGLTSNSLDSGGRQIPPASPAVVKAYVNYFIESLNSLEQREPGSAKRFRGFLLSIWLPLNQHAPELVESFLVLETLSRSPGQSVSLPQAGSADASKVTYEQRVKDSLEGRQPDDLTINFAISRGDFAKARKMIEKLPDGDQKSELTESVNTQEAISLAKKGNTIEAERLAERLNRASSILQVYPVIINKCTTRKDQLCATLLVYRAVKQLKHSKTDLAIPSSFANLKPGLPINQEFDLVLISLSRLAKAIASTNEMLALEVLDEIVSAANSSRLETGQGHVGFEIDVFRTLARNNEVRARQTASNLKDTLRQIVALAAIYQWKAEEMKSAKLNR